MIPKAYPTKSRVARGTGTQVGADVGATLTKIFAQTADGRRETHLVPAADPDAVAAAVAALAPERTGLTGGGAARVAERIAGETRTAGEFESWAAGARAALREQGGAEPDAFLLVSFGTGTSAMLVRGPEVRRVGGTALGGGTIVGLASLLFGSRDFDDIVKRAARGDRRRVDLLLRDVYPEGGGPLPGDVNAASFARLARGGPAPHPDDLAHAIMGLVGENVALICGGLAAASGVSHIVYGGGTLRGNDSISSILQALAPVQGCRATVLADGEFLGARGALALAGGDAT